jgi:hypothetical protein
MHTFVEAQSETRVIKMFFRQGEMTSLLKGCNAGLEQALDAFAASSNLVLPYQLTNRDPCR